MNKKRKERVTNEETRNVRMKERMNFRRNEAEILVVEF